MYRKIVITAIITSALFLDAGGYSLMTEYLSPKISDNKIIFENDLVSYVIGTDGLNKSFIDKNSGKDYLDKNLKSNFMSINMGSGYIGATKVEYENNFLFVTFGFLIIMYPLNKLYIYV